MMVGMEQLAGVRALLFDVFGTVVDWRGSLLVEITRVADEVGVDLPAAEIVDDWRARYGPSMDRVLAGEEPYANLDALHRASLLQLLDERDLRLPDASIDRLVLAWHRLEPWPDSVPGLIRLKSRYVLATMSNGNLALLIDMAKHSGLPWDVILTPELMQTYKKNLDSYRYVISLLGLRPEQTMMVAAHPGELRAVAEIGMRTAYVPRPAEFGDRDHPGMEIDIPVDVRCSDLENLAELLGT
jgi:2-haloacid dehalogenase